MYHPSRRSSRVILGHISLKKKCNKSGIPSAAEVYSVYYNENSMARLPAVSVAEGFETLLFKSGGEGGWGTCSLKNVGPPCSRHCGVNQEFLLGHDEATTTTTSTTTTARSLFSFPYFHTFSLSVQDCIHSSSFTLSSSTFSSFLISFILYFSSFRVHVSLHSGVIKFQLWPSEIDGIAFDQLPLLMCINYSSALKFSKTLTVFLCYGIILFNWPTHQSHSN